MSVWYSQVMVILLYWDQSRALAIFGVPWGIARSAGESGRALHFENLNFVGWYICKNFEEKKAEIVPIVPDYMTF